MGFTDTYDLMDGQVSAKERVPNQMQSAMLKLIAARKKSIQPAMNEGWHTQGNNSDSEAEGAPTTVAPGLSPGQQ